VLVIETHWAAVTGSLSRERESVCARVGLNPCVCPCHKMVLELLGIHSVRQTHQ
jgi:hypothetical protein